MARTIKRGLDYFPFDVDFFQDLRIRKLVKYQGGKAITVYALLLCTIYKNGYYTEWDKELPFIISEQSGYTEAYIQEVVECCLNIGLLSKELFESDKVLTSKGIQERYRRICSSSRRTDVIAEYNLIPAQERKTKTQLPRKTSEKDKKPLAPKGKTARPKTKPAPSPAAGHDIPAIQDAPPLTVRKYSSSIDEEVAEMKKSAQWKESVCIRYQLSDKQVDAYLADFALKCDKQHTSMQDARSHFCYWLQKQKKDESQTKSPDDNDYEFNGGFGGVDI